MAARNDARGGKGGGDHPQRPRSYLRLTLEGGQAVRPPSTELSPAEKQQIGPKAGRIAVVGTSTKKGNEVVLNWGHECWIAFKWTKIPLAFEADKRTNAEHSASARQNHPQISHHQASKF